MVYVRHSLGVAVPDCGQVSAPLLQMLGLTRKRCTDRLAVDLADLSTQVNFTPAGQLSRDMAGSGARLGLLTPAYLWLPARHGRKLPVGAAPPW